jgi:hypothetical protein
MLETVDQTTLLDCLAALPPIELKGLALMQQPNPDRAALREAVTELITYTNACRQTAARLQNVPPVPLIAFTLAEWAL